MVSEKFWYMLMLEELLVPGSGLVMGLVVKPVVELGWSLVVRLVE